MSSFGDFNRVNTNVTALEAQLSLNKINKQLGDSRLKLSTGFKINKAEDDAAGFAIATKLKGRIKGLEKAMQNVGDAKSVLNMVESAYGSMMDNLIEMKSLATQGANATLGQDERNYIGAQIVALANDINDIVNSTTYNDVNLLDGAAAADNTAVPGTNYAFTVQSGEGAGDTTAITIDFLNAGQLFGSVADNTDLAVTAGATTIETDGATAAGANATTEPTRTTLSIAATVTALDYNAFITSVDGAIDVLNADINTLGINQRTLSSKELQLAQAISADSSAQSRIMDTDFAAEQSNSIRLQILQQTATAALSQANMGPQAVLGFLGQN